MKILKRLKNLCLFIVALPITIFLGIIQNVARCVADTFELIHEAVDNAGHFFADLIVALVEDGAKK